MNEPSILKQSLLFTGKLVGVVAVWVAFLSFVLVTITGRAVGSSRSGDSSAGDKTNTVEGDGRTPKRNAPAPNAAKPNG